MLELVGFVEHICYRGEDEWAKEEDERVDNPTGYAFYAIVVNLVYNIKGMGDHREE
jgi:hypothetical protein